MATSNISKKEGPKLAPRTEKVWFRKKGVKTGLWIIDKLFSFFRKKIRGEYEYSGPLEHLKKQPFSLN